jgi:hypothetical protein
MKIAKWIAVLFFVYVGIVVAFESLLGVIQPASQNTIVITITDEDGTPKDRVVSQLESNGKIYVAANHWPRAWYKQALANPSVRVTADGEERAYEAVPVYGEERDRVNDENGLGFIRVLTGFAPREFLRLDPR